MAQVTLDIVRLSLFIAGTVGIFVISRRALFRPGSHGFYRFFAWESILGLIALNIPWWLADPLSPLQLASWAFLLVSLLILWQGVSLLRGAGQSDAREGKDLYSFEKTTVLVTTGIYGYIRHPLYASLLYLAWGACLKHVSLPAGMLAVMATGFLVATARADERECVEYYGEAYAEYMKRTKMFIPFLV